MAEINEGRSLVSVSELARHVQFSNEALNNEHSLFNAGAGAEVASI